MANKIPSRKIILFFGAVIFLFTGTIYAWSILSSPFPGEFGWTSAQLGLNFTLVMSCFCIGGLVGSILTKKKSPRFTVLVGGVLCFFGYVLCSRVSQNTLWLLYLSYGIFIGLGVGFSFNAVLGTVVGWFLDKKGFASGLLLMGFGCSTLIMGNLANWMFESPLGWRTTYLIFGCVTFLVLMVGSFFMIPCNNPTRDKTSVIGIKNATPKEMIKTRSFWLLFFIIACSNLIGTGVIGHSKYIVTEAGLIASLAPLIVGFQSVCNGLGRLIIGSLFDKKGNRFTMFFDVSCFMLSVLLLIGALRFSAPTLGIAGLLLTGFSYGGMPTLTSTVTADCFGPEHYPSNFSVINMSMLPASFGATLVGKLETVSGTYSPALYWFIADALIIYGLNLLFHRNEKFKV